MPNCKTAVPYRGTPEQEERLRKVIDAHKGQPGATMPVLQAAQEIFGYLPEEVQIMVAEGLDIPLSEIYGVASFYSFFSLNPKGKYQISVCLGTACYVKGAADVRPALVDLLQQLLGVGQTVDHRKLDLPVAHLDGRLPDGASRQVDVSHFP